MSIQPSTTERASSQIMNTTNLVKSLQSFGITAAAYKRPPAGKDTFLISILPKRPAGVIQVHQGLAKVEIHGSKKHRQAVVTVQEQPRVIKRHVKTEIFGTGPAGVQPPVDQKIKDALRRNFPIQMPGGPTWSFSGIKSQKRIPPSGFAGYWEVSGSVTGKAGRRTTSHFLLGVDESHNFIAPLKEKPTSVEHAYRILKPGLRPGSVRQGEWFFEPLKKDEAARIDKVASADGRKIKQTTLGGTTHRALSTLVVTAAKKRTIYARGYVTDSRHGHHDALFLPSWHRVVRNKEITFKRSKNAPRRRASFD